jgi:hypothetical protein
LFGTGAPFSSNNLITHQPHATSLFSPVDYKKQNHKVRKLKRLMLNLSIMAGLKFKKGFGARSEEKSCLPVIIENLVHLHYTVLNNVHIEDCLE